MDGSDMFHRSPDVRAEVLAAASAMARARGETRVGTDHLLVGVITAGNDVARAAGLSVESLRDALDRLDGSALGAYGIDATPDTWRTHSGIPESFPACPPRHRRALGRRLPLSAGAKRSLEKSVRVALDHRHRRITTNHLLAALSTGGQNDPAIRLLRTADVDPADLESAARTAIRNARNYSDG
ncbi:MAG TPA: Clp protease N-terminal domain-containing protein [Acidimicrobiia bacterium]|nr:Clp protease N-terminal domain-containing protein [Acidimicrobiia bacterium]